MLACRNALVMGVCGVGKSTVAQRLAESCAGHFIEGDTFHSPENVQTMSSGTPLTDEARWAWLESICLAVESLNAQDDAPVFIACSALKQRYRDFLRKKLGRLAILHLDGDEKLIQQRLLARRDHFMPPALLESQLRDLEAPDPVLEETVLSLDVSTSIEEVTREAAAFCRRHVASAGQTEGEEQTLLAGNDNQNQKPEPGGELR